MPDEPMPTAGVTVVIGAAREDFNVISREQEEKGLAKYHKPLETWNGRWAPHDAKQEAVDLFHYLCQIDLEMRDMRQVLIDCYAYIGLLMTHRATEYDRTQIWRLMDRVVELYVNASPPIEPGAVVCTDAPLSA